MRIFVGEIMKLTKQTLVNILIEVVGMLAFILVVVFVFIYKALCIMQIRSMESKIQNSIHGGKGVGSYTYNPTGNWNK